MFSWGNILGFSKDNLVSCYMDDSGMNMVPDLHFIYLCSCWEVIELSLQQIHDAEADLEIARLDLEKSRDKLAAVKLQLREQQAEAAQGRVNPG